MITNRKDLISEIKKLGEIAEAMDEQNIAVVLYTLGGSVDSNTDYEFAKICQNYANQQIDKIRSKLN